MRLLATKLVSITTRAKKRLLSLIGVVTFDDLDVTFDDTPVTFE